MKKMTTILGIMLISSTVFADNCRVRLNLSREANSQKSQITQALLQKGYITNSSSDLVLNMDATVKTDYQESVSALFNYTETFEFSRVFVNLSRGSDIFMDDVITGPNRLVKRTRDGQVVIETKSYKRTANIDLIDGVAQAMSQIPNCK
jgi:phosphotransferase system IIB component